MTNELGLRVSSLPGGGVTAEPALTAYWKRVSRVTALQLALLAYLTSTVYVPLPWYDGEPLRLAVSPRSKAGAQRRRGPAAAVQYLRLEEVRVSRRHGDGDADVHLPDPGRSALVQRD